MNFSTHFSQLYSVNWKQRSIMWCLFLFVGIAQAQTNLPLNTTWETSSLTTEDLIIPTNTTSLSIAIKGGDGGRIQFKGSLCNDKKILGGEGAAISATFTVGNEGDMLQAGGRLRVFTGQAGGVDQHGCIEGGNYSGGGGGSTAVLYLPPGSTPTSGTLWRLLAVAGGGGGANRPTAGTTYKGKGANSEDSGDSVQSNIAKGGKNMGIGSAATCPDFTGGIELGYSGGSGNCSDNGRTQNGRNMISGYSVETDQDGKILSLRVGLEDSSIASGTGGTDGKADGGDGFTGGAAGAGGGGGGGGSSGGAGGLRTPGGGGGSWLTQGFEITESSKSSGGDGAGSGNNGYVQLTASFVPETTCKSEVTVNLDDSGSGQVSASEVDNGSIYPAGWKLQLFDNTSSSIWSNPKTFTCSDAGRDYTVQMQLLDASDSFQDQCSSIIKVRDAAAPQAWCVNPTIQLNNNGQATLTTSIVNSGSSDNCGGNNLSFQLSQTNFTCNDAGQTREVTLTASDAAGNSGTCTFYVKVEDNIVPVARCHANNIVLDAQNTDHEYNMVRVSGVEWQSFTVQQTGLLSSVDLKLASQDPPFVTFLYQLYIYDGEGTAGERLSHTTLQIGGLEENVSWVNLELEEAISVESGRKYTIVIQPITGSLYWATDHNNPYSEGRNSNAPSHDYAFRTYINIVAAISAPLDANGRSSITINQIDNGSSDNCGIASRTLSQSSFDCSDIGNNSVTLTVTDNSGNTSSCRAVVTVEDNIAPVAKCKDGLIQLDANGYAEFDMDLLDNGFSDACGIITREINWPGGLDLDCSHIGEHPLTLTMTDRNGNSSSCDATLRIVDDRPPLPYCKAFLTLDAQNTTGTNKVDIASGYWQSFTAENTGPLSQIDIYAQSHSGTINRTLTITIYEGEGTTGKVLYSTTKDIYLSTFRTWLSLFSDASIPVSKGNQYTVHVQASSTFVIWNSSDSVDPYSGGRGSRIDRDFQFQTFVKHAVQLDADGKGYITADQIDDGTTDNCGIASRSIDRNSFDCYDLGKQTVSLTVMDVNGNRSNCSTSIYVEDRLAPIPDQTELPNILDECAATLSAPTATDNCGGSIQGTTSDPLTYTEQGTFTVNWNFDDGNGNVSTQTQTIIIDDITPPTVTCEDVTVELDENGLGFYLIQPNATDNCAIASTLGINMPVGCSDIGSFTKTVDAWDKAGNQGSCTATVTVIDLIAPIASCKATSTLVDATGKAFITPEQIDDGSSDACGIASRELSQSSFDCSALGTQTVTLTVVDVNGNSSSCNATVAVLDDIAPTLLCVDDLIVPTAPGECGAVVSLPKATPSDNCGIKNLKSRYRILDNGGNPAGDWSGWADDHSGFFELGFYEIQWRAKDDSNNKGFCSHLLEVKDEEAPEVICKDITVNFNGEEIQVIDPEMIFDANNSFDACGNVAFVSQSISEVGCEEVGEVVEIQVLGVDPNGNTNTCMAQVTVAGMPCGFTGTDVDCPNGAAAEYDPSSDTFTLSASDCDGYPNGEYSFVGTNICEDTEIIARVASLQGDGRAGVIMMESTAAGAKFVSLVKDLTPRVRTEYRSSTNGNISHKNKTRSGIKWLRIVRDGNKFKTYTSTNGSYWKLAHTINFPSFADCIFVGIMTYSKHADQPVTAVFEELRVEGENNSSLTQLSTGPAASTMALEESQLTKESEATLLLQVAPNPFAVSTRISFELSEEAPVSLQVFNLQGQLVRKLQAGTLPAGPQQIQWDGKGSAGQVLTSGLYLVQLRLGQQTIVKKVALQRR